MTVPKIRGGGILAIRPMWLAGSVLVAALAFAPTAVNGQVRPPAGGAAWNVTDCQDCHEKVFTAAYTASAHGLASQSCANCHANVGEHARAQAAGQKGVVPSLKILKANEVNQTCLSCHEQKNQTNYAASMHARRNVACTSCHSIHNPKSGQAQLKTASTSETCFSCHKSERAKSLRTSHHPVREGKMECTSCHNPHDGSTPKMIKAESVTELCYQCHAEKRGPFLFEHAPVREDCAVCHEPHGSNHNRMLKQKLPALCWSCHFTGSGHFGSGDKFSTEQGPTTAPAGAPSGYPTTNSRFVGRACINCHMNIHGSNSPSGAYFVR